RQPCQLLAHLPCSRQRPPEHMEPVEAHQNQQQLWCLSNLCAQRTRPGKGLPHLRVRGTLDVARCHRQSPLHGEFLLGARRGLRQGGEQRQTFSDERDRFVGRVPLQRVVRRLPQVLHCPPGVLSALKVQRQLCRNFVRPFA